jgi:hypothetical protein
MPSKNSYCYYNRFLLCLRKHLEKTVEDRKSDKHIDNPTVIYQYIDYDEPAVALTADSIVAAFEYIFDKLIKKAPSAQMGGDDWLDEFFNNADEVLCSGTWCRNERCLNNDSGHPYYCKLGNVPAKCKDWKAWRWQWRSYPEKEECQKCKYYKPEKPYYPHDKNCVARTEKINCYKCYCRAKKLPDGCPKMRRINNAAE